MNAHRTPCGPNQAKNSAEQGSALIWALLFVLVSTGMVVSHSAFLAASRKDRDARYDRIAMSRTFAKSGIADAIAWFRRQGTQPVTTFAPEYDPTATPPKLDTTDPSIGLVREFPVHGNLWGRYEVHHNDALDISQARGVSIPGSVWELHARSTIYRLEDPTVPYNQPPNRLVASHRVSTEIRGIPMASPAAAAVCLDSIGDLHVRNGAIIDGGTGRAYATPTSVAMPIVDIAGGAQLLGALAPAQLPGYDAGTQALFGMSTEDLRRFSDLVDASPVITSGTSGRVMFAHGLVTVDSIATFDNVLIFVDGDLVFSPTDATTINGVVYVTGDTVLNSPNTVINGMFISRGSFTMIDGAISYDETVLATLGAMMTRYRPSRAAGSDG